MFPLALNFNQAENELNTKLFPGVCFSLQQGCSCLVSCGRGCWRAGSLSLPLNSTSCPNASIPTIFWAGGGELWFWALQYSTVALLPSYISYKLSENWVPYLKPSDYFLLILGQSSKSLMRPARLWFSGHVLSGLGTSAHTVSYTEPSPNPPPLDPHFNSSLLWGPASYPFDQLCPIKM